MPIGIQARDIQYTGVASNTDLIRTSRSALDRYLWFQILSLFSSLEINHVQSAIMYQRGSSQ